MTVTLEQVMSQWGAVHKPVIQPTLVRVRSKWCMQLVEIWPSPHQYGVSDLDSRVRWTEHTLKNWQTVRRDAWDMWIFDTKREAEKFITIFNLTWA